MLFFFLGHIFLCGGRLRASNILSSRILHYILTVPGRFVGLQKKKKSEIGDQMCRCGKTWGGGACARGEDLFQCVGEWPHSRWLTLDVHDLLRVVHTLTKQKKSGEHYGILFALEAVHF